MISVYSKIYSGKSDSLVLNIKTGCIHYWLFIVNIMIIACIVSWYGQLRVLTRNKQYNDKSKAAGH